MPINIGDYTGLYFYSAVFQGNMALLALVGVFVVFKLQQLTSGLEANRQNLLHYVQLVHTSPKIFKLVTNNIYNLEALPGLVEEIILKMNAIKPNTIEHFHFKDFFKDFTFNQSVKINHILLELNKNVKRRMIFPIISTLCVILISLIFLPLANYIHSWNSLCERVCIVMTIYANYISLFANVRFIFQITGKIISD